MSSEVKCSVCGLELKPFEVSGKNFHLDGTTCAGCSINKHKDNLFKNHD